MIELAPNAVSGEGVGGDGDRLPLIACWALWVTLSAGAWVVILRLVTLFAF